MIALTALNMKGLPDAIQAFFGANPTAAEIDLANVIAYVLIALILALLAWTVYDLHKSNKKFDLEVAAQNAGD
ncbi:manganese transport protein MntH [Lentilactobacillus kosonis]|uniref:Manganese transport protein MntH n=1 Tax=Lentilactobacillus kosonis TaxID=2810561 RepID=A0A401FIQ4_9LACO|nr:manganese transport protein MntH [Lentilactobacillus kosonis]